MDTSRSHGLLLAPDDLRPGLLVLVHSTVLSLHVRGSAVGGEITCAATMPCGDGDVLCVEACMLPYVLCRSATARAGRCIAIDIRKTRLMRCTSLAYLERLCGLDGGCGEVDPAADAPDSVA